MYLVLITVSTGKVIVTQSVPVASASVDGASVKTSLSVEAAKSISVPV
jgi:hypothetical protein